MGMDGGLTQHFGGFQDIHYDISFAVTSTDDILHKIDQFKTIILFWESPIYFTTKFATTVSHTYLWTCRAYYYHMYVCLQALR